MNTTRRSFLKVAGAAIAAVVVNPLQALKAAEPPIASGTGYVPWKTVTYPAGRPVQFRRYKALSVSTMPLSEGVCPTGQRLKMEWVKP